MCIKSCLCNSCNKKDTCALCKYIDEHKEDECLISGITVCSHYIKFGNRWNNPELLEAQS